LPAYALTLAGKLIGFVAVDCTVRTGEEFFDAVAAAAP
jgi:hypothetical protein